MKAIHAREQDLAHQPHIGPGNQGISGLAADHQRQAQGLAGPLEPVHRHHRHKGGGIGIARNQRVIALAQLPQNFLAQMRQRLGQPVLDLRDFFAFDQKKRHLAGVGDLVRLKRFFAAARPGSVDSASRIA